MRITNNNTINSNNDQTVFFLNQMVMIEKESAYSWVLGTN